MKEFLKNFSSHLLFYNVFDNFSTLNSFSSQWFIFLVILESHAKISVLVIIFHPDKDFLMPKALTPTTRIAKARALIQTARELPIPESAGWEYFSYVAQVKDKLRQAFELVKLIPNPPTRRMKSKPRRKPSWPILPKLRRRSSSPRIPTAKVLL